MASRYRREGGMRLESCCSERSSKREGLDSSRGLRRVGRNSIFSCYGLLISFPAMRQWLRSSTRPTRAQGSCRRLFGEVALVIEEIAISDAVQCLRGGLCKWCTVTEQLRCIKHLPRLVSYESQASRHPNLCLMPLPATSLSEAPITSHIRGLL